MTIELDVSVAAWPIAYDVVVQPGPVLIDVAVDTRPIIVVVGQLFPDIHVPADIASWRDFAPAGVGAGVNLKLPFDTARLANFAPNIHIGVRIAAPADGLLWEDAAPAVYIGGVRVAVSVNAAEATEFAPSIQTGINLALPFDQAKWDDRAPAVGYGINVFVPADALVVAEDYAPLILTGVRLAVPGDAAEWADFSPSLSIVVDVPGDVMVVADFVPAVAGGMSVAVPSDGMTWAEYEPSFDWYGFSNGFSNGFNAVPHGEDLAIPADAMSCSDSAPTIEAEAAVDLSYIGTSTTTTINTGAAAADRYVFLVLEAAAFNESSSLTMASATIGGVAATIHAQENMGILTSRFNIAILSALVPTGTTAVVVPTYNRATAGSVQASSYRVTGIRSNVAVSSGSTAFTDTGSSWSRNVNVKSGGFVLAGIWLRHSAKEITSTDMTRDYRSVSSDFTMNSFRSEEPATATPKSFTWSNSNGSGVGPFVYASFR